MIYTEQQESRTAELILLLEELGNPGLSKHDLKRYGDRLKTIYLSEEGDLYRHSYSEITNYMYCNHVTDGVPTPDPGSVILENLREIDADWEADIKCENKDLLCSAIRKLIDHINLEVVRLGQMADIYYKLTEADALKTQLDGVAGGVQEVKKTLQEQENEVERIESGLEKRKQEVEDLKQDVKNYNAQAITVLSIFHVWFSRLQAVSL